MNERTRKSLTMVRRMMKKDIESNFSTANRVVPGNVANYLKEQKGAIAVLAEIVSDMGNDIESLNAKLDTPKEEVPVPDLLSHTMDTKQLGTYSETSLTYCPFCASKDIHPGSFFC